MLKKLQQERKKWIAQLRQGRDFSKEELIEIGKGSKRCARIILSTPSYVNEVMKIGREEDVNGLGEMFFSDTLRMARLVSRSAKDIQYILYYGPYQRKIQNIFYFVGIETFVFLNNTCLKKKEVTYYMISYCLKYIRSLTYVGLSSVEIKKKKKTFERVLTPLARLIIQKWPEIAQLFIRLLSPSLSSEGNDRLGNHRYFFSSLCQEMIPALQQAVAQSDPLSIMTLSLLKCELIWKNTRMLDLMRLAESILPTGGVNWFCHHCGSEHLFHHRGYVGRSPIFFPMLR